MTRLTGKVEKGWGSEEIWATNDRYCLSLCTSIQVQNSACTSIEKRKRPGG
jgi:hypothetical protein